MSDDLPLPIALGLIKNNILPVLINEIKHLLKTTSFLNERAHCYVVTTPQEKAEIKEICDILVDTSEKVSDVEHNLYMLSTTYQPPGVKNYAFKLKERAPSVFEERNNEDA